MLLKEFTYLKTKLDSLYQPNQGLGWRSGIGQVEDISFSLKNISIIQVYPFHIKLYLSGNEYLYWLKRA